LIYAAKACLLFFLLYEESFCGSLALMKVG